MNEPTRMKRYHTHVVSEEPEGGFVRYTDIQAWAGEVMGLADKIDLRPWIDCACGTCQENGERLMKLKAKLGEVS